MNRQQNRENIQDYENLLQLYIDGLSDSILVHLETGIIYDNLTPTDYTLEYIRILILII